MGEHGQRGPSGSRQTGHVLSIRAHREGRPIRQRSKLRLQGEGTPSLREPLRFLYPRSPRVEWECPKQIVAEIGPS